MADNTRVNELQDKLLQAMDILNAQALNSISFDKTITCTIENDEDKKDGRYEVSDGNKIFVAYSSDTRLRAGDTVYVTIPEGNFENQKMIIGKKTADNDKPFNFTQPFDTFFDMTGNLLSPNLNGKLLANSLEKYDNNNTIVGTKKLLETKSNLKLSNYTRLGLKADFKSWIKEAVSGDYGLLIEISTTEENIVGTTETEANDKEKRKGEYVFVLNSSDMYGNPYNFETYYTQEIVIPIEQIRGIINEIKISFYQNKNFIDKYNEPILCSEKGYKTQPNTNIYELDADGDLQLKENDTLLEANLFVENIELSFGYDISIFNKDYVEIYTQDKNTYRRSTSTEAENNNISTNQKYINMRWVHLVDGNPVDMSKNQTDTNYEIRWYKYQVGAAAADEYCGVYWVEEKRGEFNLTFNPDVNKQQEKIKAIVLCDGIPYRSNELIFENEEQLPPSEEAQHIANALNIEIDDGTKGNYFLYGQGCRIKDQSYATKDRTLNCLFDADNDGVYESKIEYTNGKITWIFPNKNTMIELVGRTEDEKNSENETIKRITDHPVYRIARIYNSKYTNNTIQCIYTLNGVVYTTEIDLTFGKVGTMGSDQTLVIDFIGDTVAYTVGEPKASFEVQLFDTSGTLQNIPKETVKWEWYCNEDTSEKVIVEKGNSILNLSNVNFNIEKLYILQATVGTLTTYFPIPIKNASYSYIDGPTEVIYRSDGKPDYSDLSYQLYGVDGNLVEGVNWEIIVPETAFGYKYIGKINEQNFSQDYYTKEEIYEIDSSTNERVFVRNQYNKANSYSADTTYYEKVLDNFVGSIKDNKLQPVSIYIKDAPVYGIKAMIGTGQNKTTVWSQPIFVCQNQYPSTVINQWDGKSLVLDEENSAVIAAAVSAGRKNSDNTFSGVMMGDWSSEGVDTDGSISGQTGLYGFHHGAMSYAFKEDGTAFIGKSSMARINFDGSNATIYSSGHGTSAGGMMINLYNSGEPYIELESKEINGIKSEMRFSTKNSGSTIYMKNGTNQFIKISNENNDTPLQIGSNFNVSWNGNIEAKGGSIGNWNILSSGALQSNDKKITLNTASGGSIVIGNLDSGKITIDASGNGSIIMSNKSYLTGGTIYASTLSSNNGDDGTIYLDGYLEVLNSGNISNTFLGYIQANTGDWWSDRFSNGVGFGYGEVSSPNTVVKATSRNVGLSFANGGWISIDANGIHFGTKNNLPSEQTGIYARFA